MNQFNFKSQICTTRKQSERLLALGLKKETADVIFPIKLNQDIGPMVVPQNFWISDDPFYQNMRENSIPAWSLHRLIKLAYGNWDEDIVPVYLDHSYDMLIGRIEFQVKQEKFNKEYLA